MAEKRLIVVVEGTAAVGPFPHSMVRHFPEKMTSELAIADVNSVACLLRLPTRIYGRVNFLVFREMTTWIFLDSFAKECLGPGTMGLFVSWCLTLNTVADHAISKTGNGALAFDSEYARWLEEHQRLINDLKSSINSRSSDNELCFLIDGLISHYDKLFVLKSIGTKTYVFHILSGTWKTPSQRFFMWLGGFPSSELLKIIGNHLEPTGQQLIVICNLQQSSQQAEDALSQGMEALQQSLMETLSSISSTSSENVADYMAPMAIAMAKLATLENFLNQADLLRQQTLHQLRRILSPRQAAIALIFASEYVSRVRALSSLWLARPRE